MSSRYKCYVCDNHQVYDIPVLIGVFPQTLFRPCSTCRKDALFTLTDRAWNGPAEPSPVEVSAERPSNREPIRNPARLRYHEIAAFYGVGPTPVPSQRMDILEEEIDEIVPDEPIVAAPVDIYKRKIRGRKT